MGHIFLLAPFTLILLWLSWPYAVGELCEGEVSSNAGGLPVWPAKFLIFAGMFLLFLQLISELIKRSAVLAASSRIPWPHPSTAMPRPIPRRRSPPRMIDLIAHNLAPLMFLALIFFLLLGYPVAFALAANGLLFFFIAVELSPYSNEISLSWPLLNTLPGRVLDVMRNDTLLAIPFFTFMGIVLEKSGMAEDLLDTVGQLFGPVRGGLAFAVLLVGALLAATTGVVAASVMAMGLISLPIMLRYGYDRSVATGVIAASGTLAQIIPPSLVLIVLADQLGRSWAISMPGH